MATPSDMFAPTGHHTGLYASVVYPSIPGMSNPVGECFSPWWPSRVRFSSVNANYSVSRATQMRLE